MQLPGGDYHWFDLAGAERLHDALEKIIERRKSLDAWHLKHEPDGYEARALRRRRSRRHTARRKP